MIFGNGEGTREECEAMYGKSKPMATIHLDDIAPCVAIIESEFPQKAFIRCDLEMAICKALGELYRLGYRKI
jgi:hypothetical protein